MLETFREARPPGSPAEIYLAILTANLWWRYILTIAERKTGQGGAPVYMYRFDFENGLKWEGSNYPQKATHTAEIPFKFDNPQFEEAAGSRPERLELAAKMGRTWAAFARNGNPNNDAIPKWPEFTLDHRETMIWDEDCKITDDPCRSERLIWDQVGL